MILSIVLPTMPERSLSRTIERYENLTPVPIQWITEYGHNNCGAGWNAGVPKATGEILHMGADDIEPVSDHWFPAALACLEAGNVPLGWIYELGQKFGRDFARVVICRREWWQDVLEHHYWSDNSFDDLMREAGHMPVIAPGFDFLHRKSMINRNESPERLAQDHQAYEKWREGR